MNLMDEYGVHPLLGVIPECKDISICQNKKKQIFGRQYESTRIKDIQ